MTSLIIFTIIAIIGVVFIILAIALSNKGFGFTGFIILLFDVLIGFGLICSVFTHSSTEMEVEKFSYAKTESVVIIQTPKKTQTFSDAYTFNSISDSSKVVLHIDYNAYGIEVGSCIVVK